MAGQTETIVAAILSAIETGSLRPGGLIDEQELIEAVHQAQADGTQFIIINPAAFTHTSVALRDALAAVDIPCIEVHISNVYAREPFRHHSYISDIAEAVISGLGSFGYDCALAAVLQSLDTHSTKH